MISGDFSDVSRADISLVSRGVGWTNIPVVWGSDPGLIIVNNPGGSFAAWARQPGVKIFTRDFNGDTNKNISLVNQNHIERGSIHSVLGNSPTGFTIKHNGAGDFAG